MEYQYRITIRKEKELKDYSCHIQSLQSDPAILLDEISDLVEARVSPKTAARKIEVITTSKYFEDFTAKTDIEILQVDVKAVEQSYMCQESFLAVIQYREC